MRLRRDLVLVFKSDFSSLMSLGSRYETVGLAFMVTMHYDTHIINLAIGVSDFLKDTPTAVYPRRLR